MSIQFTVNNAVTRHTAPIRRRVSQCATTPCVTTTET